MVKKYLKKYVFPIIFRPQEIFFKNLGLKQTILKNTSWLAISEIITSVLKFFLFVYIARILGATGYGKFGFSLAFVGLFSILADLGVTKIINREFAKDKEKERDFPAILSLKLLLSLLTIFLIFVFSFFVTQEPAIRKIIWVLGIFVLSEYFLKTFAVFFRSRQRMEYQAFSDIFKVILITGLGLLVLFFVPSLKNLTLSYLFAGLFSLMLVAAIFHFKVFSLKPVFDKSIWLNYLTMSWPLVFMAVLGKIYVNIDSITMGYLGQITQTGWYNAAQRISVIAVVPAGLVSMSFFPALSKLFKESKERFQRACNFFIESMIFLAAPLLVGGIVLAVKIIDFIYDPSFFPAILAFQILLAGHVVQFLASPFSHTLLIANHQKKLFFIALFSTLLNVVLNLILIPKYSLYGAAIATFSAFMLNLFLVIIISLRYTKIKPFNSGLIPPLFAAVFSALLMGFVISQVKILNLHVIYSILIGACIYVSCFLIFKILGKRVMLKKP